VTSPADLNVGTTGAARTTAPRRPTDRLTEVVGSDHLLRPNRTGDRP
jgi:hypothetical protein